MNTRTAIALAAAALVVAGGAVWVSMRGAPERAPAADRPVLASLADSLDAVTEIRLSRGDGAATTLQRRDGGWFVAQRDYPADPGRLRTLLSQLAELRTVEEKTSDPARYAALNVADAAGAQSRSVRIDVVAAARNWALLLGKTSEPDGCFVRVPGAPAALLAKPRIQVDPEPAHWIRTELTDVAADRIQQVTVQPAGSPSYSLTRAARGAADMTLHGVPPGRKPGAPAVIDAVGATLARLTADDVKARASGALDHPSRASFRTFEGLQVDLAGYRDSGSHWIRVDASVDPPTARRYAAETAAAAAKAQAAGKSAESKSDGSKAAIPGSQAQGTDAKQPPDPAAEAAAINARLQAFDFRVPAYQYDQIYRQLKDLLAALPQKAPPERVPR